MKQVADNNHVSLRLFGPCHTQANDFFLSGHVLSAANVYSRLLLSQVLLVDYFSDADIAF